MQEIFDHYIENSFGEKQQATFKFKQFEINYKKYFPTDKSASFLDIGIGRGEMLTCFQNWGYNNYLGIDISPSTIDYCKSINLNCKLVKSSALFLQEHKEKYDLITLIDVLEHIPREEVISFLHDIKNALKKNGILIIQVPNLQCPDGQLHMYNDITHLVGYIEHSLQQVLITAGFKSFHFQGFEEFTKWDLKTLIKKLCRVIYWKMIRFFRTINGNLNPHILNPVISVIVKNT